MRLILDCFLNCNISDIIYGITCKLGMAVDVCVPHMLMLVSMTLNKQGHSESAKANKSALNLLSATKQVISIKFAPEVGHF